MTSEFRLQNFTGKENRIRGNPNKKYVIKGKIKGDVTGGGGGAMKARVSIHI